MYNIPIYWTCARRRRRRRKSLAWFGPAEVHQEAFDRATRALVVG